jgi:hypothetical protein
MTDEEIAVAVKEVRIRGKRVSAHARSAESVKQCVRHGIEIIYHTSFADEEALDMLTAKKDRHFVAPGIAWLINTSFHAAPWGITPDAAKKMGYHRELEIAAETLRKMHKRGIRILPGGDYGFAWIKHGTNAKDLEYLVKYVGLTPMEALLSATKLGGQIMLLRPPGGGLAPALDLQLRDRDERPCRRGRPATSLRRPHEDEDPRAPSVLDIARPRGQRPPLPPRLRDSCRRRGGRLPPAGRLALPGLLGAEPVLGVGVRRAPPGPRAGSSSRAGSYA